MRQEIDSAFERPDDAAGDDAVLPDWRATIRLIVDQSHKTRDMTLAVYLLRAATLAGDTELVVDSAQWLARLVEERWDDVHPQLDEVGFTGRKALCESLTRVGEFLNPLLRVPLLAHPRLGKYTGADFDRFHSQGAAADGYGMFRELIKVSDPAELQAVLGQVDAIRASIAALDAVLVAHAGNETATNFKSTYETIDKIRRAFAAFVPGAHQIEPVEAATGTSEIIGGGYGTAHSGAPGSIASRDDVARTLDALTIYFDKFEPSSPIPLLLRRARDWIGRDFLMVLEDIAPGSLDDAKRVLINQRSTEAVAGEFGGNQAPANSPSSDW